MRLEQAGIATALICSDEFGPLGRAEAEVLGFPGLPLVAVPHPLAGNDAALVGAKAEAISAAVVESLTMDAESLSAREASRFRDLTERRLNDGAVCIDTVCAIDLAVPSKARSA